MQRAVSILPALGLVGFTAVAACFVWMGRPLIDEGVYLSAAELVWRGELPYRDFPSSQGPGMPYLYGLFTSLFGASVAVGRWVSFGGCLVTAAFGLRLARARGGDLGAFLFLALFAANLPALWSLITVTTQAGSTPFVMAAAFVSLGKERDARLGWPDAALVVSLLLWSTSIRLTNGLLLAAAVVWVGVALRGSRADLGKVFGLLGVQAAVVFAPVWLSPKDAWFHVVGAQLSRGARRGIDSQTLAELWTSRFGFLSTPQTDYFPVLGLTLLAVAATAGATWGARREASDAFAESRRAVWILFGMAALSYAPHVLLQPGYPSYFVTPSVLACVAIAIVIANAISRAGWVRGVASLVVVAVALTTAWDVRAQWRTWLAAGGGGPARLRAVGAQIARDLGPECTMATFQTHLALESGCLPLPGLEYGMFSFFRDLPPEVGDRYGVLTPERLDRHLADQRPEAIAFTRRSLLRLRPPGSASLANFDRLPDVRALDFLPYARDAYGLRARIVVPSGLRLGLDPGQVRVLLFVRRDLPRPPAAAREGSGG